MDADSMEQPDGLAPGDDAETVGTGAEREDEAASLPERVQLPTGDGLTPAEVDAFLRRRPARFVTIVGDRESGKTTLICAIYDRFLRGDFADHLFAGSRSLLALESRSHYARVDSDSPKPDTPRTSLSDGLRFFHFALAPIGRPGTRLDLMLSDRAGESYTQARGKTSLVRELREVAKADKVVLLLDGARVADPAEWASALQNVRQSLRVFLDNGAVAKASQVQVVTTKIDLLRRVAVMISAWDVVDEPRPQPAAWLKREFPLLQQFLAANQETFTSTVYGISAQGGDVRGPQRESLLRRVPSERIQCVGTGAGG